MDCIDTSKRATTRTVLRRASAFTVEELVNAYNQTRVDYIVPMPMNVRRLNEYIHNYDVKLEHSAVAMSGEQILGLSMLGVRPGHCWCTRLGVLPGRRNAQRFLFHRDIRNARRITPAGLVCVRDGLSFSR